MQNTKAPKFRARLIPATLIALLSIMELLVAVGFTAFIVWSNVKFRWIEPDPDLIDDFNERFANPPMIAAMIAYAVGAIIGIKGMRCWMRGEWLPAVAYSLLFVFVGCTAAYLLPPDP